MTPKIFTVLRSGGEYKLKHVESLARQLKTYGPAGYELHLLTDNPTDCMGVADHLHPLKHKWPGWWSKLELFRFEGTADSPILYMDLDTVLLGDLWPLFHVLADKPMLLSDFYRPQKGASGLMAWTTNLSAVYEAFKANPKQFMTHYQRFGDQAFIEAHLPAFDRWQDKLPREVISYKVHVRGQGFTPPGALVCCFHGQPRPWDVADEWARKWHG